MSQVKMGFSSSCVDIQWLQFYCFTELPKVQLEAVSFVSSQNASSLLNILGFRTDTVTCQNESF